MPQLPFQGAPTVEPERARPVFRQEQATPAAFGAPQAAGMRVLGEGLNQLGTAAEHAALAFQRQQNETDVDAASTEYDNRRREILFGEDGFYTKKGKSAYDSMTPTATSIEELRKEFRQKLGNPEQQRMFDTISRRATQGDLRSMSMHAATENQRYRVEVTEAAIANNMQESGLYWNDPARFAHTLGNVRIQAENRARLMGRTDPEQIKADVAHYESEAWQARIRGTMLRDPVLAQDMYRANAEQIRDPNKRVVIEHELKSAVKPVEARKIAEFVMRGGKMEKLEATLDVAGPPLVNAVIAQESGGDQSSVSPKGAIGIMQVMPDTARAVAAELGLEYDEKKLREDPAYNKALGTKYLQNMLLRYGGNQTLALAAYNAGPDRVDQWIQRFGNPQTGQISDTDFAARIPFKETREYVGKIGTRLAKGAPGAAPTRAYDTRSMLGEWISQAETYAEQLHPGDPVFRDLVTQRVKSYVSTVVAAQEGQAKQAHQTLMAAAIGASGAPKPTSVDQLLGTEAARQAWLQTDPTSQRGLVALLEHNAREALGTPMKEDSRTVEDLLNRMYLPNEDPRKIRTPGQLVPFFGHGLNRAAYDWLTARLEENKTPEGQRLTETRGNFLKAIKPQFDKSTMVNIDAKGAEDYYKFQQYATEQERTYRAAGKDPYLLYDPTSTDYLGKKVPAFQRSLEQQIKDMADSLRAAGARPAASAAERRREGESIDAYLARLKQAKP